MVQSINSKVDLVMAGTSYMGLTDYGKIMIGNKGFEFFNERDVNKYIQIPWDEVDKVIASVMFRGRFIPRCAIQTKKDGTFSFAAKDSKKLLRAMQKYVAPQNMVRSLTFFQVLRRNLSHLFKRNNK